MKRVIALLLTIVVLGTGCIGEKAGLTEEKILNAISSIDTAEYSDNVSATMTFINPVTNRTVNMSLWTKATGVFNLTAGLRKGNVSFGYHLMGMDLNGNWPYFANGTDVYMKVDGRWYRISGEEIYNENITANIEYIKELVETKNVTFEKLPDGYSFRVNVTFWELAKATNQDRYLESLLKVGEGNIANITTNTGWVEVHLKEDGTPVYIETYMDVTMSIKEYDGTTVPVYINIHEVETFSKINEHLDITAPEGIENALPFDEVFG